MSGITGLGTTYNLPNFHGELLQLTPADTPFTTAIGGLTPGADQVVQSTTFEWQTFDLRDADQRTRLEGADAPTAEERVRDNVTNVVEIHQEAVSVSYTKLAAVGQYDGANIGGSDNPVMNESVWQIEQQLKQVKRDVEYSFLNGSYVSPSDNATARQTRGILAAISTNEVAAGNAVLTEDMVLDLLQEVWDAGGITEQETATIILNSLQKRRLTDAFITDKGYEEASRNVGGVNLQTIETDFGRLNVMLNRYMPTDAVAVVSLEQCKPKFLEIPGKGVLFVEPLAKTGAQEKSQLYGEIGLEYGNERAHGKITDLNTLAAS